MDTADKLILKACRRYIEDGKDTRYRSLVRRTRIFAFGEVAADVLGICMTPAGFESAVMRATERYPHPNLATKSREAAAIERELWDATIIAAVKARMM